MSHQDQDSSSINEAEPSGSNKCLGCLEWLTKKLRLVEDGATPPNWKYIGLSFLALFSSASTLTFLFPFLPEMMLTFGYSENEKGKYGGMVASAVFAGRIVGSVFWGWLADRSGRKLVLLITIALNGLFAGLFGLSSNIIMAIFFRFMCGMVNGTVGTGKAILYDISDNTNQAVSMSMLSLAWGMGMIVGPSMGGILASPALKWANVFNKEGVFGQYPYLLASLFPFFTCVIVFIVIFVFFDETFISQTSSKKVEKEILVEDPHNNEVEDSAAQEERHLPFLTGRSKGSGMDMHHLGQSMQSVNIESESSAYMALELAQKQHIHSELQPLAQRAQSDPYLVAQSSADYSTKDSHNPKISQSTSNLYHRHISTGTSKLLNDNASEVKNCSDMSHPPVIILENENSGTNKLRSNTNGVISVNGKVNTDQLATEGDKLLLQTASENKAADEIVEEARTDEHLCWCVENGCRSGCCAPFRKTSLYKLLRLSDVWATIMLYTVFSVITIGQEDIFPVFASTTVDYGGLNFSTDEIGMTLGIIYLPLLALQIKLYPFLVSKFGIRKVFLMSAIVSLVTSQSLPTVRVFNNNRVALWACLILVQIPFKIATNCCFAGTALLINNSVTQELAGQANGLAMMVTAMGRTFAPLLAGSLFTWTVTYGPELGFIFDTSFPFFVIGIGYFITIVECLYLNPKLDKQKK